MEVIKVDNVYKSFKIYYDRGSTFKEKILFKNRNRHDVHEVLKGISLSIKKGEVVGLIGENGSGKSTLLKLMTRIIYPDKGTIKIKGKVSSLLELGAGFHPDMTGRENIYTNASIFGLTKREIDERLEKIIDFSELGEFIDNPVRTYSSGMYMRLAFSVAINVDAEILLIDEILAVGDTNFQQKCFERLRRLKKNGTTIVIVSHDTGTIETFCDRAVWLLNGEIVKVGKTRETVNSYLNFMNEKIIINNEIQKSVEKITENQMTIENDNTVETELSNLIDEKTEDINPNRWGTKEVEIIDAFITDQDKKRKDIIYSNSKVFIKIKYKVNQFIDSGYIFGIRIIDEDGRVCYGTNTYNDGIIINELKKYGEISFNCDKLNILKGIYFVDIAITDENYKALDFSNSHFSFKILSNNKSIGLVDFKHDWEIS
ncbi:ABC transporter ATP-binding protein [Clostridium beijerinckii]|uniref:ABC-2 type transport system ATP-binding protein n=1 Tax=Clostridium beijerinckii TaxID=1520 RepID=A0AAX0B6M7_CLOBE|nr:ABC transporter ATP-binding protein [Clostridium beijerinckii]NRT90796.1 ABC-2 type transport system ATP-binding protein [Clostridium beijerinckii]NYC70320.1 ABC-2 type transport system ATP-binding protein [Clostridium beijerinckii]